MNFMSLRLFQHIRFTCKVGTRICQRLINPHCVKIIADIVAADLVIADKKGTSSRPFWHYALL